MRVLKFSLFIFIMNNLTRMKTCKKEDEIIIYGPGLSPDILVMPARYFFVFTKNVHNSSEKFDLENLKVEISGSNIYQRNCRIWTNILDRKDGSIIVRYKVYETCRDIKISIKNRGQDIGRSPFIIEGKIEITEDIIKIKETTQRLATSNGAGLSAICDGTCLPTSPLGTVQPEDCYCPESVEKWLKNFKCPRSYSRIEHDLHTFPSIEFSLFHDYVVSKINNSGSMSICNYVIKNNQIYRKCYGQHVGFKMFTDAILSSLARKVLLPDIEIFINLGDWPLVQKTADKIFPILSWCGSTDTLDIVLPTYDITEASLEAMGRVSLDMLSVQGNTELSWSEREPRAFWRGRDSRRERLKLIEIAREHPDLFNASLTNFFFFRDVEHIYGPKEKHVSFFEFFKYRYQVSVDGTVAAYRLPYLLAGGSLVLKQDSHYYEHFYGDLVPWKHFVPVKRDLSDLVERVKWARDNDRDARKIALNGQKYARENLLPDHIFCYHVVLLKEWAKRLKERVEVRKGMEKVEQPDNKNCVCDQPIMKGALNMKEEL